MVGLGTIINVAGIICGGLLGLAFGKRLPERFQNILIQATSVCVLFLGIGGCMEKMLQLSEGKLVSGGSVMMILCFVLGSVVGELINIDQRLEQFGIWLKEKTGSGGDTAFVNGFVTASLTVCIGAMAVVGAVQDGIYGDYSILAAKAVLDLIIILVMTASMGKGCIFSAIPVGLFQGVITVLAVFVEPFLTEAALANLSLTGSIMIFCIGINLIWDIKIKVANMLPTLFFAVLWDFIPALM
ncbi:DUF554 domain-containing protein [Colidextribacter sp. OB.20]|uniref:DUF554 domain-containing protein n=1 Tax=Colidextribacter sp. OB.20 TaxID=2304568 RepID=UPI00136BA6FB|nr:DUF554 domain-containing protein [Colidextribacter sp. OB.20]NBI09628.1 DUF554 domain-containing protein [Colidextribacter sp. OB.20]